MFSRTFGSYKHASLNQLYGKEKYIVHLDDVAEVIKKFKYQEVAISNFDQYVIDAAYLHDIIEDTDETQKTLSEFFHSYTVDAVLNLSDIQAETRSERKQLTNAKFSLFSTSTIPDLIALIVKPADRFANMSFAFNDKSSMMKVYFKEYPAFRKAVYRKNVTDKLWIELDKLYKKYEMYFS